MAEAGFGASALVVIAGPTAVGKTAVAVALARRIRAEIVCADSRTLYRGMDIGTAKPSPAERAAVPHHLLDIATPDQTVTLVQYQHLALRAIEGIAARGRLPLLVGGTGLYIHAVVDRLAIPQAPPDWQLRARLELAEQTGGAGTLHRRLAEVDPAAAARIHPRNVRRIIRALEVHAQTGVPISSFRESRGALRDGAAGRASGAGIGASVVPCGPAAPRGAEAADRDGAAVMIVLTMDRARLYERIDRRIDRQIADGLIDEVRALVEAGYADPSRPAPATQGLGYREILAYLRGRVTLDEAIARLRRNTRRYAKRQWTWFRADPRYRWLDVGDDPPDVVAARIHAMLLRRLQPA